MRAFSHGLDERTGMENQSKDLYLTSWGTHNNTLLCCKSCIRGTQCHQSVCGNMDFTSPCSCTGCAKKASRLRFRWQIGEKDPVHQIYMQDTHFLVPSFTRHALSHWLWHIIHVGQRECISSRNFSKAFLSRTLLLLHHNECDGVSIVCSIFVQAQIKENIRALHL